MVLPGCLFVCHLILLPMCFLFNMYTLNPKNWEKHELNHFKDNRNTILDLFSSLTCDNKMARERK